MDETVNELRVTGQASKAGPADADGAVSRQQWKWTALAGMASYLDAGSIVALGAGLVLFQTYLNLSNGEVGVLAAIGPNAIGCAIGAVLGGWLGDKIGRKRIYQYDLLLYAAAVLLIALAVNREMLFLGVFVAGIAVGADVPTSLALVGEFAPPKARGKLLGFTQAAWLLGPVIVLWLAVLLAPLGLLGIRIIFMHLCIVALITWALRRGLTESPRWTAAKAASASKPQKLSALFTGRHLKALIWTGAIYTFFNLAAGTMGVFKPYIIRVLGAGDQAMSVGLHSFGLFVAIIVTLAVFMRFSDRTYALRKRMWAIGAVMQVTSFLVYLVLPFTVPVILLNTVLFSCGSALAGEAFYKVFSQELFPTLLRGTAQGITFGTARVVLGIWSFFVPILASTGIETVAALLAGFVFISGMVGYFFMPDTGGRSLEDLERERSL